MRILYKLKDWPLQKKYLPVYLNALLIIAFSLSLASLTDKAFSNYIYFRTLGLAGKLNGSKKPAAGPAGSNFINKNRLVLKYNILNAKINGGLKIYLQNKVFIPVNLKLIGVITGPLSYGFFLNSGKKEVFYAQGSMIKPGVILKKVGYDYAVLSENGSSVKIYIVKTHNLNPASFASGSSGTTKPLFAPSAPASNYAAAVKKTGVNTYVINKSLIGKSSINSIYTQMHAVPDIVGGKIIGFRVVHVMPAGIFAYMGIENGDVIKKINGTPLTSPAEAVNLLTGLINQKSLSLDLQRGNGNITLNYKIE